MQKVVFAVIGGYHFLFFILTPLYFLTSSFNLILLGVALLLYAISGVAITAGYHRFYSHKTYKVHPVVEFFLLAF